MFRDEIGDVVNEINVRLKIVDEISLSSMNRTIKEVHFDTMVEFRDFLNKFLSKWDLSKEGILT